MGWKTVRTLGAILCVGRLFPTVNPKYPPFRVFLSVIAIFVCVFGEICHAEAEKICRKKELKEVQKEDAEDTENVEDTERKGYGGVYDKAVLPSQAWGGRALCRMRSAFEIFAGQVGQLPVRWQ